MSLPVPTHVVLAPTRWARPVAVVVGLVFAAGCAGAWLLVRSWEGPLGQSGASRAGVFVIMGLVVVFVMGVQLVRSCSRAVITFTDETIRSQAGGDPVRLARIVDVDVARFGKPLRLLRHGATRATDLPGTVWLTATQREELAAQVRRRRDRALAAERRRSRADQIA